MKIIKALSAFILVLVSASSGIAQTPAPVIPPFATDVTAEDKGAT